MPKISKVTGPPGTGKTTYLMRQIENASLKYDPERIGAISYTKAAVVEMQKRVANTLDMGVGVARNIRTVHSHCYRLLGVQKDEIVTEDSVKHIRAWNVAFPKWEMPIKSSLNELEDGESMDVGGFSAEENKNRYKRMNILRERGIPEDKWPAQDVVEVLPFYRDWMAWLRESDLKDFTMTLELVHKAGYSPEIDVLFIDEAQDMSWLQIQVAKQWAERCESVIWVGDEDQCLYRWSGAAPEDFRNLRKDWSHVLSKSYRVPQAVYDYAIRLISQIKERDPVSYLPTEVKGDFRRFCLPDLNREGSKMLIARCSYHLKRWMPFLIDHGMVWHNPYRPTDLTWNPASTKLWKAVRTYDLIKSGMEVTGEDLLEMIAKMPAEMMERGVKTNRKKMITMDIGPHGKTDVLKISSLPYFKADFYNFNTPLPKLFPLEGKPGDFIKRHGTGITRKAPEIILGSVHSVKGGEADHVWVDPGASPSILRSICNIDTVKDDETRIAYVAVTRARKSCGVLYPRGAGVPVWV